MSDARHRAGRGSWTVLLRRRRVAVAATALSIAAAAGGVVVLAGWQSNATTEGCEDEPRLRVVAAPEIAPVVAQVVGQLGGEGRIRGTCTLPLVRAEDPARTARALAEDPAERPDVWLPDSSLWPRQLQAQGIDLPGRLPSVASSPFVLAVPAPAGQQSPAAPLRVDDLLPSGSMRLRWTLAEPRGSASSAGALLMASHVLRDSPDRAEELATLLRSAQIGAAEDQTTTLSTTLTRHSGAPVAVATIEQQGWSRLQLRPGEPLSMAYAGELGLAADYPFVVLADGDARRSAAEDLLAALRGRPGADLVAQAGFRNPSGVPGAALTALPQVDTEARRPVALRPGPVQEALSGLQALRQGSRLLTVLDVSGSMAKQVPGAGATRLDLAVRALLTGLATYPEDTVAGLWTFSTDLTPNTDHRRLVPSGPLGTGPDGTSGRARLAAALNDVEVVPYGGTGLYDTTLAAVRAARQGWDPERVNSVVLVTDGANEDSDSIGLDALLTTLKAERDPARPVSLFTFAYGPSADHASLRRIVGVTGGAAYRALDFRDLGSVIADGIGRRAPTG